MNADSSGNEATELGEVIMADIKEILDRQRAWFSSRETLKVSFRMEALKKLKASIQLYEKEIFDALKKDLNKAPFESYATEVGIVIAELSDAIRNLRKWSRVRKVRTPIVLFKSSCFIVPEPYGVVLIMSPWNYPFQLSIAPLVGAIAAGNCAVLKPSAYSPAVSAVINKIIKSCFDEKYITVIEGGREANQQLLNEKFDYVFFTGSVSVGKTVMEAASKHLTPITLELGGKSPCIVDKDVDIDIAARRITWGKTVNSGQTCVAPDYLLVHRDVKDGLLAAMKKYIREFYGEAPCNNDEYPKIINEKHFNRLRELMKNGDIVTGGEVNEATLQISPTILDHVHWDDPVMQEEIFGPILPVLEFDQLSQVITAVNNRPKPLALYLFTNCKDTEKKIIKSISFGGGCINDTVVHTATSHMPFGGVGESGMGSYHGKWSFETFTHRKSILKKSFRLDLRTRYAPYTNKLSMIKKVMR